MAIGQQGQTSHPILSRIYIAQAINRTCGTAINPWDVDQLPDEWIDAFMSTGELRDIKSGLDQVKQVQDKIRREHQ